MSEGWGGKGVKVEDIGQLSTHSRIELKLKIGGMASGLQKLSALYIEKID